MKRTTQNDWPLFLLFTAIFLGGLVRFLPAAMTRFPINDGGMFYTMVQDLRANHYALPLVTTYNHLDIPFAYPPFGFYVASLLADVGRIPLLGVFLWLPAIVSTVTLYAFYLVVRALLGDKLRAALATAIFALTPGAFGWHIMGGGLTRSFGLLFLLLGVYQTYQLFNERDSKFPTKAILLVIVFCSLAVLSHPEVGIQTAGLCAVLWLFFGRTWRGTLHAALVALGVAALSAPWWGTVLAQHGLTPFLSAMQTGMHANSGVGEFLASLVQSEGLLPLLVILRMVGLVYALWQRKFLLVALLVVPFLVDPRSSPSIMNLSFSMLAALAVVDAFPAAFRRWKKQADPENEASRPLGRVAVGVQFALLIYLFIESGIYDFRLVNTTVTAADREAMAWVQSNVPADATFLLVTGRPYSMTDPVQEWFPSLTGRISESTLQGFEWTLGAKFLARLDDLLALQNCADAACVQTWSARTGLTGDYLWLAIPPADQESAIAKSNRSLVASVGESSAYRVVYQSKRVAIFERVK